jgi:hypothetical protein
MLMNTELLRDYVSPKNETSVIKGVPIKYLDDPMIKLLRQNGAYIRFRGPRRSGAIGQATCLKADATSFAVYWK